MNGRSALVELLCGPVSAYLTNVASGVDALDAELLTAPFCEAVAKAVRKIVWFCQLEMVPGGMRWDCVSARR